MSDEFGSNYISISDDEGNEYELEHLDTIEIDGEYYLVCLPADLDENDERYGIVILKSETDENGEDSLVVPDDDELQVAYDRYMQTLFEEDNYEED